MKKISLTITLMCSVLLFSSISCKKDDKTASVPAGTNTYTPAPLGTVEIILINDTVDFSTTSNTYEWSIGMDFDSLHTDFNSPADYLIQSQDTNTFFNHNRHLIFAAGNDNRLFLDDDLGGGVKKYLQSQTIDYNTVTNYGSSAQGIVTGRILEEGVVSDFNLNETFYLGTAFLQNGSYYNGWIKVKTLNNYYSCVIVSYGVCKTANAPVKAE